MPLKGQGEEGDVGTSIMSVVLVVAKWSLSQAYSGERLAWELTITTMLLLSSFSFYPTLPIASSTTAFALSLTKMHTYPVLLQVPY